MPGSRSSPGPIRKASYSRAPDRSGGFAVADTSRHQSYSVWADLLDKFHTSSDPVQALWLAAVPTLVLGVTWLVMRGLRDIVVAMRRPRSESGRLPVYDVVQDQDGQWQVIRHGREPKPLDWRNPPPELLGQVDELD